MRGPPGGETGNATLKEGEQVGGINKEGDGVTNLIDLAMNRLAILLLTHRKKNGLAKYGYLSSIFLGFGGLRGAFDVTGG